MVKPGSALERGELVAEWLERFNSALEQQNFAAAAAMFRADGYWRDMLSFTWEITTFQGTSHIAAALDATFEDCGAHNFRLEAQEVTEGRLGSDVTIEAFFEFETKLVNGRGYMRLVNDGGNPETWKALTFLTTAKELKAFPSDPFLHRRREAIPQRTTENWLDRRKAEAEFANSDPEVLIIGAGQAGLALGARLNQLDVSTLLVDKFERVGDNWRKRYHSLTLHNEICTNHLPYIPFPPTWPVYVPKDMIADFFEFYAMAMELNIWTSTTFLGGEYDPEAKRWTVRVQRADGTIRTMRPSQVVLAMGISGAPRLPTIPGMDSFAGQVVHSSRSTVDLDVEGKTVLVVGAGTSAHDIAQDLYLRGAQVTMLQRSSTTVVSLEPAGARAYTLFKDNEGKKPMADLDLMGSSVPFDLVRKLHMTLSKQMAEDDKELLSELRKVGFLLDNGEDDTGFFMKLLRYHGGYYINVGASNLIIEGKIKLRSGVGLARVDENHAYLSDGSSLQTDMIVMATGYQPFQNVIRAMFGTDVADRVGPVWGIGPNGELRNMWTRTKQQGLFVAGGTFPQCRNYSQYTAIRIKAELEGLIPESASQ